VNISDGMTRQDGALKATLTAFDPTRARASNNECATAKRTNHVADAPQGRFGGLGERQTDFVVCKLLKDGGSERGSKPLLNDKQRT
jgi:hypothetical protein